MPPAQNIASTDKAGTDKDKIVRRKLSEQVFDRLRDMIVAGELHSGDAMPSERHLMDRFGVGRPAVREALQSMQSMGLETRYPMMCD